MNNENEKDKQVMDAFRAAVHDPQLVEIMDVFLGTNSAKVIADAEIGPGADTDDARLIWYAAVMSAQTNAGEVCKALLAARLPPSMTVSSAMLLVAIESLRRIMDPRQLALLIRCAEASPSLLSNNAPKPGAEVDVTGALDKLTEILARVEQAQAETRLKHAPKATEGDPESRTAKIVDAFTRGTKAN